MKKIVIPVAILMVIGAVLMVLYVKLGETAEAMSSLTVTSSDETQGVAVDLSASNTENVTAAVNSEIISLVSDNVVVSVNNVFSVDARGEDETQDDFVGRLALVMSGDYLKGSEPFINAWAEQVFSSKLLCSGTFVIDETSITYENGYSCFSGTLTLKVGSISSEIDSSFLGTAISETGTYTLNLKVSFGDDGLIRNIEVI